MARKAEGRRKEVSDQTAPIQDELISAKRVAQLLGVTPGSVDRYDKDGIISVAQLTPRGHRRWWRSKVEAIAKALRPTSTPSETGQG